MIQVCVQREGVHVEIQSCGKYSVTYVAHGRGHIQTEVDRMLNEILNSGRTGACPCIQVINDDLSRWLSSLGKKFTRVFAPPSAHRYRHCVQEIKLKTTKKGPNSKVIPIINNNSNHGSSFEPNIKIILDHFFPTLADHEMDLYGSL